MSDMMDKGKKITKLKTLVDIPFDLGTYPDGVDVKDISGDISLVVDYNDNLRSAAREWIKELEKCDYPDGKQFYRTDFAGGEDCGNVAYEVIEWIKHFFNLAEG